MRVWEGLQYADGGQAATPCTLTHTCTVGRVRVNMATPPLPLFRGPAPKAAAMAAPHHHPAQGLVPSGKWRPACCAAAHAWRATLSSAHLHARMHARPPARPHTLHVCTCARARTHINRPVPAHSASVPEPLVQDSAHVCLRSAGQGCTARGCRGMVIKGLRGFGGKKPPAAGAGRLRLCSFLHGAEMQEQGVQRQQACCGCGSIGAWAPTQGAHASEH